MSRPSAEAQYKRARQLKLARLEIVAKLYKRGYSYRQIMQEVKTRLGLEKYVVSTVLGDVRQLLKEWRENRIEDMDSALQLELERIDDTCRELWSQWEKSKEDYARTTNTRKGSPVRQREGQQQPQQAGEQTIRTFSVEERIQNVVGLGDPRYIAEIRQQLAERRKLLGLYAPEKREVSGGLSFTEMLIDSGMLDETEREANP